MWVGLFVQIGRVSPRLYTLMYTVDPRARLARGAGTEAGFVGVEDSHMAVFLSSSFVRVLHPRTIQDQATLCK